MKKKPNAGNRFFGTATPETRKERGMKAFAWRRDVTVGQHGTNHDDAACAVMKAFQRQRVNRKVRLDCNRSSTFFNFFFFFETF